MHSLTSAGWSDRCKAGRRVGTKFKDESDMAAKNAVAARKQPRELTEEEILKAPEKDYMNEAQLAFFR
jgi:hypothetical protein